MRQQWSAEAMTAAINAVRKKEMGYLKASKVFNVPRSTLERKVKCNDHPVQELTSLPLGRKSIFSSKFESDLADYIVEMEARLFGLTSLDVRRLAFQLAKINGIPNRFNSAKEIAGKDWLASFSDDIHTYL